VQARERRERRGIWRPRWHRWGEGSELRSSCPDGVGKEEAALRWWEEEGEGKVEESNIARMRKGRKRGVW
jgi:hypothetical protein